MFYWHNLKIMNLTNNGISISMLPHTSSLPTRIFGVLRLVTWTIPVLASGRLFCSVMEFQTGFHYVAKSVLRSWASCLFLPCAGASGRHHQTRRIVLVTYKSPWDGEVFLDTCFPILHKNSLWENTVILLELTQFQLTKKEKGRVYSWNTFYKS